MNSNKHLLALLLVLGMGGASGESHDLQYQTNVVVETYAGSGFYGLVDGQGEETMFNKPGRMVADGAGNAYVWDGGNGVLRAISPGREVRILYAGPGEQVTRRYGCDASGNVLFISDGFLYWVPAGGIPPPYLSGTPRARFVADLGLPARYSSPADLAVAPGGDVFVADMERNLIKRIALSGELSVHAGSGNPGHLDGKGIFCSLLRPQRVAVTPANELFVAEQDNTSVRFVTNDRLVVTLPQSAEFANADVLAADADGNLYTALGHSVVKRYSDGRRVIVAGDPTEVGYVNGPGRQARFNEIGGIVVVGSSALLVADTGNHRIRRIALQVNSGESPILRAALHFGVTVQGLPGREYRLERTDAVGAPWIAITNFVLPTPSFLWLSPISDGSAHFRSVLVR